MLRFTKRETSHIRPNTGDDFHRYYTAIEAPLGIHCRPSQEKIRQLAILKQRLIPEQHYEKERATPRWHAGSASPRKSILIYGPNSRLLANGRRPTPTREGGIHHFGWPLRV